MPDDLDIYRSAKLLTDQHGEDVLIFTAQQADRCLEAGDLDGKAVWMRVIRAIGESQGPGTAGRWAARALAGCSEAPFYTTTRVGLGRRRNNAGRRYFVCCWADRFYRRQGRGQKVLQGIIPARPEGGPKRTLGSRVCEPDRSQERPLAVIVNPWTRIP